MPAVATTAPSRRLRVLHIPKTAGTSLCLALSLLHPGPEFLFSGKIETERRRFASLPREERDRIVFVRGHAPLTTDIPEVDGMPTVTLLREPVARVRSFCQHVWEGKSPHLRAAFPPGEFALDAFLESGNPELHSLQTRLLIGREKWESGMPPHEAAELAFERLHELAAFGLVEQLDRSLLLMQRTLRWPWLPRPERLNRKRTDTTLPFSAAQIQTITEFNRADALLYENARGLFTRRLTEAGATASRLRLEKLRSWMLAAMRLNRPLTRMARS